MSTFSNLTKNSSSTTSVSKNSSSMSNLSKSAAGNVTASAGQAMGLLFLLTYSGGQVLSMGSQINNLAKN